MSGLAESKRERNLRIWRGMTPQARDYDRFVARQIPQGATWSAETDGGRAIEAERDRMMDSDDEPGGCSCHISAPCSYCFRDTEEQPHD